MHICNVFIFKDKSPSFLRSGIVYKFQCDSCSATYYGKAKRHLMFRMCKHLGISALTGKWVKGDNNSAIKEQLLFCNHTPDFEDFSILSPNNNDFNVTLMEILLINRDFFFLSAFSFTDADDSQDSRGREGTFFHSTLPLPPAHEHSDIYLQLCMWDDYHVFLIATLVYQTATRWDLPPYRITIWLIDDVTLSFCLFCSEYTCLL